MRHGGVVLAERIRTEHAPTIEVTKSEIGSDGVVVVQWQARGADADPLTYSVFYSVNGQSFESVAVGLEAPELRFPLDAHAPWPNADAAVRVRASDGWNFAEAAAPLRRDR